MALSRVVSEIFNVEKYRDLEIPDEPIKVMKVLSFDRLGIISYECSIVTLSLKRTVFEIFDFKCRDLENRVRGPSRSLKMSFDRAHRTSC